MDFNQTWVDDPAHFFNFFLYLGIPGFFYCLASLDKQGKRGIWYDVGGFLNILIGAIYIFPKNGGMGLLSVLAGAIIISLRYISWKWPLLLPFSVVRDIQ
jgi:hypothetical protein